jgi:hypothetical protein
VHLRTQRPAFARSGRRTLAKRTPPARIALALAAIEGRGALELLDVAALLDPGQTQGSRPRLRSSMTSGSVYGPLVS